MATEASNDPVGLGCYGQSNEWNGEFGVYKESDHLPRGSCFLASERALSIWVEDWCIEVGLGIRH